MAYTFAAGAELRVNTSTLNAQDSSAIAALAGGGFVVTWRDASGALGDASGTGIKAQLYDATGAAIGGEFLVNTSTAGNQTIPTVTGLAGGGFVVAWQDATGMPLKAQIFDAAGAKSGAEIAIQYAAIDQTADPMITATASGGFMIAFEGRNIGTWDTDGVYALNYSAAGVQQPGVSVVNAQKTGRQSDPVIRALDSGGYIVTWTDTHANGDGSGSSIKAQLFDSLRQRIGPEILVNSNTAGNQADPTLTVLSNGYYVVTWTDWSGTMGDTSGSSVKGQILTPDGARFGAEFRINSQTGYNQIAPSVSALKYGGFVVTWTDGSENPDSSLMGIKARIYGNDGTEIGEEFLVNTQEYNSQSGSVVTALEDGGFVISWSDSSGHSGDSSGGSIKAKVFTATAIPANEAAEGNDTLTGFGGADTIDGLGGQDTIDGAAGHDVLGGGDGNDLIVGGVGNDTLDGGIGDDTLTGDGPFATPDSNQGRDGRDSLSGGAGSDLLLGGAGLDTLDGGEGDDVMYGGAREDVYYVDSAGDQVIENSGEGYQDKVFASIDYTLTANVESLILTGTADLAGAGNGGNETIEGNAGNNLLSGEGGGDQLWGRAGDDTVNGGEGSDTVFAGTGDDVIDGGADNDHLSGSDGNDTINAGDGDDAMAGEAGDDSLTGGAGDDNISSQTGNDTIDTGDGNDWGYGGAGSDLIDGGLGNDTLNGEADNDTLNGGAGADSLDGGAGNDWIDGGGDTDRMYGGAGDDVFVVDVAADQAFENADEGNDTVYAAVNWRAGTNIENVVLTGTGNIQAYGNVLNNALTGNTGNNTINGYEGNDTLNGGEGNDKLDGGVNDDRLYGGAGIDQLAGGEGSDSLEGGDGNDQLNGGARWDTLRGGEGNDILDGGADNDAMYGGVGNDTYVVNHIGDRVYETYSEGTDTVKSSIDYALTADVEVLYLIEGAISGTGNGLHNAINGSSLNNVLSGGLGNDSLYGWDGNDSLIGGNDHDRLSGGNGSDTLLGGHGNDVLGGGTGADDFVFSSTAVNGHDHIVDFEHGLDRLVFNGSDYGFASGHVLTDAEFTVGAVAVGSAAQFVWDSVGRHLYFDADGDGAGAAVELAMISGGATVTKEDLTFV